MLNQTFCISTKIDAHRAIQFYSWKNEHIHLWFIFSWQGGWLKKNNQNETKIKPCIEIKARPKKKKKRVAQLAKAQMRGKINKNAFLQCLDPLCFLKKRLQCKVSWLTLLFSFHVYGVQSQNGKSWQHLFPVGPRTHASIWLINTVHFSTMVIPCSCLGAVDLYQTPHLALCPQFHGRLRPTLR